MTQESAVKVCVRVRPLIEREESAASESAEPAHLFWKADKKSIHQIDDGNSTKSFSFDRVFTAQETTNQLYQNIAKPLVVSTVEGYNGTIFAYGQTSSGKTFTMMGSNGTPGVIPLAVEDVFQTIKNFPKKEFLLRVSYMEIYNETVSDLLVDSWKRKPLEVRETINKNIYVADLTEELVTNPSQALSWIRKGEKNRHYGKTKMNQRSSRSHTIFRMILESRERSDPASGENADGAIIVSHLNLVDLAGSERASQTGAEGARFKEGCNINRSLFTLGQVIKKLTDESQKGFTNYRDSKLTRILQNSLGGNAKTVIICTITPVTLEETLSTLQFASTAKKMKNDPHVTEVSDDGALLKRYRNEIVDLKRRLNEVSSVTQTTATEKDFLSQLLQEKDQLQREQEDRIRNLTQLLVTSSNQISAPKRPKRRVTWGGKMLRLAHPSAFEGGMSELSFAEPFSGKRKAERSYLSEMAGDDEDFHWGIPEDLPEDMELNQSSVTVRSFGDSPKDFVSPDRMRELSSKVSHLEMQLEMEIQQKEEAMMKVETLDDKVSELEQQLQMENQQKGEAMMKVETLDDKVSELEQQLQTENQQKGEAMMKVETLDDKVSELEQQLQTENQQKGEAMTEVETSDGRVSELEQKLQAENQQKLEALEKVEMLEVRVADLEEQSHTSSDSDDQMRREFAETVQLCEHLATEKDVMATELDYLKQELGMFIEQTESLETEKAAMWKELEERRETDEFKSLEEEFRKEQENELQNEISSLKEAVQASEVQSQELQNKLDVLSEELKKKSDFVEELQSMSGKDLVQEVAKLRRSLDDAEGLSRDTKKEWAHLRSENIALEESNVTLTTNHENMEAEVNSLRFQLEKEKSRYRQMQSDLQKELNVVFDENTKLTTLLDGKVPKNLIDSVELERTVAGLNKELAASHEAEEALRAQLDELASIQTLQDQVDNLMQQVCELTEELCAAQTHRDSLISAQAQSQEEALQLRDALQMSQEEILTVRAELSDAALREEQVESLRQTLENSEAEKSQLNSAVQEELSKLTESEELRESLTEKLNDMQQLVKDLEEKLADSEVSKTTEEEISKELQEQLNQLTEELRVVRAETDTSVCAGAQPSAETENKLFTVAAERDQLKADLQKHVDMAAETQLLLQSLQNELQEQRSDLEKLYEQKESDLREQMQSLSEELERMRAEKETLPSAAQMSSEETEKLLSAVSTLTAERDQLRMDLQENVELMIENQDELRTALERNNEQKEMIKQLQSARTSKQDGPDPSDTSAQLEELQTRMMTLSEQLQSVESERDALLCERTADSQTEEMEKLQHRVTSLSEDRDQLQDTLDTLRQEKQQLREESEGRMETLQEEMKTLTEQLQSVVSERDALLCERTADSQTEEMEKLQHRVTSLSEDRDQLQDTLDTLRQEKQQLREESEGRMETLQEEMKTLTEQLQSVVSERETLLSEKETSCQSSSEEMEKQQLREEMEKLQHRVTSLSEDRDQLQETLEAVRQEKKQLREEMEERMEMVALAHSELNQPQTLSSDLQTHDERVTQLQQETEQLQAALQTVSEEKSRLEEELQRNVETAAETQSRLESLQQQLQEQNQRNNDLESLSREGRAQLEQQVSEAECRLRSLEDELQQEKQNNSDLMKLCEQKESDLEQQTKTLSEQLTVARAERDAVMSEKETSCLHSSEEMKELKHRLTSLSEDREQLREEMEERMEMLQSELQQQQLNSEPRSLREEQEAQQLLQIQQLEEHLSRAKQEVSQLKSDLQENVELMIENQEELRVSQEKIRVLQEEINVMRKEKTELESKQSERNDGEATLQIQQLQNKVQSVTEQLQSVESERDALLRERTADSQPHSEEMEKLQHRVTSLSEDRYQLQETLEAVRQEKQQLREEMETLQEEVAQLNMTLQTLMEQKKQLEDDLQQNINTASTSQELLESVQEKLQEQKRVNGNLEREIQEKDDALDQQVRTLTEELQSVSAERDKQVKTLSEKLTVAHSERDAVMTELETSCLSSSEDMEKLQHRVTSLSEDRDQLQVTLEAVRQEKQQLAQTMEDKMETLQEEIKTVSEQLQSVVSERDALLCKRTADSQTHSEEMEKLQHRVTSLSEDRDQLQETLEAVRQEKQQLTQTMEDRMEMISSLQEQLSRQEAEREEREAELQQKLLTEANETISALKGQLSCLDQSSRGVKESAESQLQDSADQLQEAFRKLQNFIEACSKFNSTALGLAPTVQESLTPLPKPANEAFCQVELQAAQTLGEIIDHVQGSAQGYRTLFEELVRKDLDVYEERRLQDVLLCRAQAPSFSVKDEDFNSMWEQRLSDLLDKRNLYLKKMECVSEKLLENIKMYSSEVSTEKRERARFKEQLKLTSTRELDSFLSRELDTRSALSRSRKTTLKGIIDEHNSLFGEMKLLQTQTDTRLQEERSRRLTLLQPLEGAPLKTELSLMKDNKQLCLQLQETEERIKALCAHKQQLEEAQIKANNRVSNHKEATQLLQTELQDSRAQVEEKENMIQTLRSKLRESERNANPSAAELEKLQTKLFKMEVELSSASDKHQQEIQRMTTLLKEKEESLRKLKETLRKSQQQGEESFLQGEDLHARLTNPRGVVIKTSILQEKTKLEEEVKQLQMKITELESLVSAQQAEIGKWKSRAIKLKAKNRTDADKPSPPCTPTKRGLPVTADSSTFYSSPKKFLITPRKPLESPMKQLDSPNVPLLDSPKSRFFDVGGGTELLSRTCPKQFFDNSSLGTVPEVSDVPDSPAEEKGAGASADRKDEWWPQSPKQEDMCKTQ
ncbi:centromere-associated protein E isoform X1 [Labrus mixtus]|uniref:centromere-associated protein E isoform X1 n=1 Tax=Labrus mixtus TaxID=508554 RepID=UPI0029BFC86F|nr:centromere-associated protein E isoform X1 [Labrus mixtus]